MAMRSCRFAYSVRRLLMLSPLFVLLRLYGAIQEGASFGRRISYRFVITQ